MADGALMESAWAIIDKNGINVRSVCDSRRGAIVNWLCTEMGLLATSLASDEDIELRWAANKGTAVPSRVNISIADAN